MTSVLASRPALRLFVSWFCDGLNCLRCAASRATNALYAPERGAAVATGIHEARSPGDDRAMALHAADRPRCIPVDPPPNQVRAPSLRRKVAMADVYHGLPVERFAAIPVEPQVRQAARPREIVRRLHSRLAALVPKPRAHLTRYHRVFAPAGPDRARIVPRTHAAAASERGEAAAIARQRALTSAQRLKRVFAIEFEFGVLLIERDISIGSNLLIGRYNIIHHRDFGDYVLVGERCPLLSGSRQHSLDRLDVPMAHQGGLK